VLACEFLFFKYVLTPIDVFGDSMLPTLKSGEKYHLNKVVYHFSAPKRGDIVVAIDVDKNLIIKRIVGLPGETIELVNGFGFLFFVGG
jgi:signal peptidase I